MGESIINGMSVEDYLAEHGCTRQQIASKTVELIIDGMEKDEITSNETVRKSLNSLAARAGRISSKVDELSDKCSHTAELLGQFEASVSEKAISDPAIMDGINAFARIIESVRDTFGEDKMTEPVICAAIEAGSYGCWRSIMGPKTEGEAKRRSSRRDYDL